MQEEAPRYRTAHASDKRKTTTALRVSSLSAGGTALESSETEQKMTMYKSIPDATPVSVYEQSCRSLDVSRSLSYVTKNDRQIATGRSLDVDDAVDTSTNVTPFFGPRTSTQSCRVKDQYDIATLGEFSGHSWPSVNDWSRYMTCTAAATEENNNHRMRTTSSSSSGPPLATVDENDSYSSPIERSPYQLRYQWDQCGAESYNNQVYSHELYNNYGDYCNNINNCGFYKPSSLAMTSYASRMMSQLNSYYYNSVEPSIATAAAAVDDGFRGENMYYRPVEAGKEEAVGLSSSSSQCFGSIVPWNQLPQPFSLSDSNY